MSEQHDLPKTMDINQIRDILPHRFPFLLIDRIIDINAEEKKLVAIKNVTANEQHFIGHYPEFPVMPGVLLIEAMAQAAGILFLSQPDNVGKMPFFTGIDGAKFRRMVVPGDQVRIEIQIIRHRRRMGTAEAKCFVDGQVAAEAVLTCMIGDKA